ncbi:hypothetical protein BKP64_11090 [Marinobacter salinus]|uniref:DUF4468 domain-containing protein n=1 Tax=Marinobacter salinus TaxID=1874317 RepID=A0A1D9GM06_9GAMM|nr:DUF4468 domain-containing protein [Marinobacter salinus]AOY88673.1 hypothetical protein BKP64_11090 [Marinobacter salinus]
MFNLRVIIAPLLSAVFLSGCASFEQTPQSELSKPITYIYEFPGEDADDLYSRSRLWVAETYNSAEAVITFDDQETGTLKGTGVGSAVWSLFERHYKYNLGIDVKDGKTRLQFSNFQPLRMGDVAGIDPSYREAYEIMKRDLEQTAKSYQSYMANDKQDDW